MSVIFFLAILIGLIAAVTVARVVGRWQGAQDAQAQTNAHLKTAATALEQYVASASRLPCPADPTQNTGLEVPGANSYSCGVPAGSLPWATLGMRRDDAFDGWGWKIDYRVYTGNAGSLVQPGGASMVLCNTNTTPSSQTAPTSGGAAGGQCQPSKVTAPGDYSTTNTYLQGKGLTVSDFGVTHADSAYVLISHGPTGYGAYTTSGLQKPMPTNGDELANTMANATFRAQAWSDPTVGVSSGNHFDDLLFYRSVADLMKNANLLARAWPGSVDVLLNQAAISAVLGATAGYGDLGQSTINFGSAAFTGNTGTSPTNLTLASAGGTDGIGVANTSFNPFTFNWQSNYLTSAANQSVHIAFPRTLRQLAVTLDDFGYDTCTATLQSFGLCSPGNRFTERVQFTFNRVGVPVASVTDSGCKADGGLASFSMTVPADFDSVDVTPLATAEAAWAPSFFLLSEIAACASGVSCATTLAAPSNNCTSNTVTQNSTSVTIASKSFSPTSGPSPSTTAITVTMSYSNVGNVAASGVTLSDVLPSGMSYAAGSGSWSGAPNATLTDAADGNEMNAPGIDYSYDPVTGTVSAVVQSVPVNGTGFVSFQATIPSGVAAGAINNSVNFGSSTQAPQASNPVTYTVTQ